ncbi:MAG TPA: response regulator [Actinomycetota bacterium]|nr:response regulator [Actinomycetota bacterium]
MRAATVSSSAPPAADAVPRPGFAEGLRQASAPHRQERFSRRAGRPTIVVADDEKVVREELCQLLGDFGFTVLGAAADGLEAVELLEALEPEIMLLDLRMPGLDGIEAARRIKKRNPLTQVVILSAYEDASLMTEALEVGVYCYLVKGCNPRLIRDVLTTASTLRVGLQSRSSGPGPSSSVQN